MSNYNLPFYAEMVIDGQNCTFQYGENHITMAVIDDLCTHYARANKTLPEVCYMGLEVYKTMMQTVQRQISFSAGLTHMQIQTCAGPVMLKPTVKLDDNRIFIGTEKTYDLLFIDEAFEKEILDGKDSTCR